MAAERHGSRWLHEPPSEDQVKTWFRTKRLHPGMTHEPYFGGIVIIGSTEKLKVTKAKANGDTYTSEIERATFTPYVKVDTRIDYFWDFVWMLNGGALKGEYVAKIRPVPQARIIDKQSPYYNEHLPEGYSVLPIRNNVNDGIGRYMVANYRVAIYERESWANRIRGEEPLALLEGEGAKQSAMAMKFADDNVVMKVQTGAIGRALGVAGILNVGTGVATAEDMQEALAIPVGVGQGSDAAVLPDQIPAADVGAGAPQEAPEQPSGPEPIETDEQLRERALTMQGEMERDHPAAWGEYRAWWKGRGFGRISELSGPALRGATIKLERDLDKAKRGET